MESIVWDNEEVKRMFISDTPATHSPSVSSEPPSPDRKSVGPIVGGSVGGVVALLIIVGVAVFVYRRRKTTIPNRAELDGRRYGVSQWAKPELDGTERTEQQQAAVIPAELSGYEELRIQQNDPLELEGN